MPLSNDEMIDAVKGLRARFPEDGDVVDALLILLGDKPDDADADTDAKNPDGATQLAADRPVSRTPRLARMTPAQDRAYRERFPHAHRLARA